MQEEIRTEIVLQLSSKTEWQSVIKKYNLLIKYIRENLPFYQQKQNGQLNKKLCLIEQLINSILI